MGLVPSTELNAILLVQIAPSRVTRARIFCAGAAQRIDTITSVISIDSAVKLVQKNSSFLCSGFLKMTEKKLRTVGILMAKHAGIQWLSYIFIQKLIILLKVKIEVI